MEMSTFETMQQNISHSRLVLALAVAGFDGNTAMSMASNIFSTNRTKLISLRYHYIKELI